MVNSGSPRACAQTVHGRSDLDVHQLGNHRPRIFSQPRGHALPAGGAHQEIDDRAGVDDLHQAWVGGSSSALTASSTAGTSTSVPRHGRIRTAANHSLMTEAGAKLVAVRLVGRERPLLEGTAPAVCGEHDHPQVAPPRV